MWIVGNDFAAHYYEEYFKRPSITDTEMYIRQNYEITGYHNKYLSTNPNMVSRICNTIIKGLKEQKYLPKLIVVVLDDDLIKYLNFNQYGFSYASRCLLSYIMIEFKRILEAHAEHLPKKAKHTDDAPKFVWIQPPLHRNFTNNTLHNKFAKVCDEMARIHPNNFTLELKKGWDEHDDHLYLKDYRCFTDAGLVAYWRAGDKTIKYADTILIKKINKKKRVSEKLQRKTFNPYHWHRDVSSPDGHRHKRYSREEHRHLPTPPR